MNMDDASPSRTSHRLSSLATYPAERVSLGDALSVLGERGFGLLLLILSLPNAIPLPAPPGVSLLFSVPLLLVAAQMALGYDQPIMPGWLERLSLRRERLAALLQRALPHLERIERRLRPRHAHLTGRRAERMLGMALLVLVLVMCLPIPMGNAPIAWAMVVLSLGLLERDGLFTLIGLGAGLIAVLWNLALLLVGGSAVAMAADVIADAL